MIITSNLIKFSVKQQEKIKTTYNKLFEALRARAEGFNPNATTNILKMGSDYLVHNELIVIRCSSHGKIKWKNDFHSDIIKEITILDNKIKVVEFDGSIYYLSKETGKEIKI